MKLLFIFGMGLETLGIMIVSLMKLEFFFSFQSQDLGTYVLNKQIRNRQFGCLPQRGNDSSPFIPSVLCFFVDWNLCVLHTSGKNLISKLTCRQW